MPRTGVRLAAAGCVVVLCAGSATADALADEITLPTSDAAQLAATALLKQLPGFRPDRLLPSSVPGPVVNDEVVRVGVAGDGTVAEVLLEQRLTLTGTGDYAIRERGPARSATSLSDDPAPLTQRGAVVWQGFSPGSRALAARLVLDPAIEAAHLPLVVEIVFTAADGSTRALDPGGVLPGPGTVRITFRNVTEQPAVLPTGQDVAPGEVAPLLDRALALARRPSSTRLPASGTGLPPQLTVTGAASVAASQATPLRLTGALRLRGTTGTVTGPATSALPDGARLAGVLGGATAATFAVKVDGPGALSLELTAVAAFDPRVLQPPRGLSDWAAWARSRPPLAERQQALDLAVEVAATGARASSYSPYLGADLTGSGSTAFDYSFATAPVATAAKPTLQTNWGAVGLASLALLLLLGAAEGLRRQF